MTEGSKPSNSAAANGRAVSWKLLAIVFCTAAAGFFIDFAAKEWVLASMREGEQIPVIGDLFRLHFVRNPGAAFSIASGSTWIFTILASAVVIFIVSQIRRIGSAWWALALGGVLGGTLGNLYDRLFREPGPFVGHVVDYLAVWGFPAIFNIADVFIVSSMCGIVLLVLRGVGLDGSRTTKGRNESESAPESESNPAESLDTER